MALSTFSTGRDTQLVVIGPFGRIDLAHVTGFECRQMTQSVRVNRLDGKQIGMELPKGWEGYFDLERGSSGADDFIARIEQDYFNGIVDQTGTMYQYVTESDGSTSTYQFETVVFHLVNAGQWKGDAAVHQKMEFYASRRRRV